MKKNDVKLGAVYLAKVSGAVVPVRLTGVQVYPRSGYIGRNTETNREIHIKTAARLRSEVVLCRRCGGWALERWVREGLCVACQATVADASKPEAAS